MTWCGLSNEIEIRGLSKKQKEKKKKKKKAPVIDALHDMKENMSWLLLHFIIDTIALSKSFLDCYFNGIKGQRNNVDHTVAKYACFVIRITFPKWF
jgi:hypothetical protein